MNIRPCTDSDLARVTEIAAQVALGAQENQSSFLVSAYTENDYRKFLNSKQGVTFLVCVDDNETILGFLLAYNHKYTRKNKDTASISRLEEFLSKNSEYEIIKQVAVAPDVQSGGVATMLYQHFIASVFPTHIFATIVTSPHNPVSEGFHKKMGFTPLLSSQSESKDGEYLTTSRIWHTSTNGYSTKENDPSLLMENLQQATALYQHEDNLNWTKVQFLVSVLFALIVAAWAIMQFGQLSDNQLTKWVVVTLSALIITSGYGILFFISRKLTSGLEFLAAHKQTARIIEAKITNLSASFVPPILQVKSVAATQTLLSYLPNLAIFTWSMVSILLAVQLFLNF